MRFGWLLGLLLVSSSSLAIGCAAETPATTASEEGDIYSEDDDRALPNEPDEYETTAGIRTLSNGNGGGVDMTPTFASPEDPSGAAKPDTRIQDHLHDLINGTPDGEEIHVSAFLFADAEGKSLAEDLVRAHEKRHVKVRVVHDGKNQEDDDAADKKDGDTSGQDISDYMRKHIGADDYVMCKRNEGDSGSCIAKQKGGRMHAKFALFSKTNGNENVVWISSNNMNSYSGTRMFNNSLTVRGDKKLYDGLHGYFADLIAQKTVANDDYYDPSGTGRGYTEGAGGTVKVHASPTAKGDILLGRLDNITPGEGCHIRLAESDLSAERLELVDRLEELGKQGCTVQMVVSPQNFGTKAQAYMAKDHAHIQLRTLKTHDKVITIYAKWNGSSKRKKVVLAGSHNFADSANRTNDELLSVVEDNRIYNRYTKHVLLQWKNDAAKDFDTSATTAKTARSAPLPTVAATTPCEGAADGYYCSEEFGQPAGQILSCIGGAVVGYAPCPTTCAALHDDSGTATCE